MNRVGRAIAGLVVLSSAAVSVVAAASGPAVGKSYETALPQYVQGYWPGENPRLCILDLTYGEYPIADAMAQYDDVDGISMHVTSRMVACLPGEWIVRVAAINPDQLDGEFHGRWVRGDASRDSDGLWVHSTGGYIALDSTIQDRTIDAHWVALIAHELGHALGLSHTNRQDSVMRTPTNRDHAVTPTDIAVLNDLYSDSRR